MLEETAASRDRYTRFLKRITETGIVWTLHNGRGVANCPSGENEATTVLLFWSERAWARRCVTDAWSKYAPKPLELSAFKELWLPGMLKDGALAGPEWTQHLIGLEVAPDALLADLVAMPKS
jgi:hypothetical protein